jgi:hypothetical protein
MFRLVAMTVPNYALIAELLSQKMIKMYKLSS